MKKKLPRQWQVEGMPLTLTEVKRFKDSEMALCVDCGMIFSNEGAIPWTYNKSKWGHEQGMGHEVVYVKRVLQ